MRPACTTRCDSASTPCWRGSPLAADFPRLVCGSCRPRPSPNASTSAPCVSTPRPPSGHSLSTRFGLGVAGSRSRQPRCSRQQVPRPASSAPGRRQGCSRRRSAAAPSPPRPLPPVARQPAVVLLRRASQASLGPCAPAQHPDIRSRLDPVVEYADRRRNDLLKTGCRGLPIRCSCRCWVGPLLPWVDDDGTCSGPRGSVRAVTDDRSRDRDDAGRPRQGRPRDALGRPLPYGAIGVEPVPEEALPPVETIKLARRLVQEGRPFAAHEVFEARWKGGPDEERDLWQGLAQVCVGLTHAARGNSIGAARLLERGAARVEEYEAGHGAAYGLDLTAVIACVREHAAAEH